MTDEEKDRTNMMKTMMIEHEEDDELSISESIEEFEDKIDYLDITDEKKDKLRELCSKIKEESDDSVQEYLFNLLQSEIE